MRPKSFCGCYLLIVLSLHLRAQDSLHYPVLGKTYIKSYYTDTKALVLSPLQWRAGQWLALGTVAVSGAAAYTQDEKVQKFFTSHQSATADRFSKYVFTPFRDGISTSALLGAAYLSGLAFHDRRLSGTSLTAGKALIITTLGTHMVKQLCHRHRPYQDATPDHTHWDGPFGQVKYASFFSGHSSSAWSIASVFALEYKNTIWVPVLACTLATGTALSRMYDNKHWLSDVLIGSAFGFATGRFMWKQSRKAESPVCMFASWQHGGPSLAVTIPVKYR